MKNSPFFTVFTPVFNRSKKIHRVFESLINQTCQNFEWIIIDDGSTDDIDITVDFFRKSSNINIIFLKQQNKGKHFAWNKAVSISRGELFVPADSDDSFESNTLEFFLNKWNQISDKSKFSGINVLCIDPNTRKIVGDPYPKDALITNMLELTYKFKIKGEKWGCVRVDILKDNHFPEITGRGSYILSYIWFNISHEFNIICYNSPLRHYFLEEDNITTNHHNVVAMRNALPILHDYTAWHLKRNGEILLKYRCYLELLKLCLNYWRYSFLLKLNFSSLLKDFSLKFKFILIFLFFPSIPFYIKLKKFLNTNE